jgi:hypothetical protein
MEGRRMNSASEPIFGITLGWLPILLVWLPLSIWLLRKIGLGLKPGPFKWATLGLLGLVLAAIPVGDDAYIQWHFNRLCRDAGMHYEKKIAVDGFYDSVTSSGYDAVEKDGFRFVEHRKQVSGKLERVERVGGEWRVSILDRPTARYHYKFSSQHDSVAFQVTKFEAVILDTETSKVVGRQTVYTRYPGWLDSRWLGFFDARGKQCPPSDKAGYLPTAVLIPTNKQ